MAWSLPSQRPLPRFVPDTQPHPLFDPSPPGPILSRCEMCNSRGWRPSAPGREKGEIPAPILRRAGARPRLQQEVRNGAGGWGSQPPDPPPASSPGSEEQLRGWGKTGPGGSAHPPGPLLVPHRVEQAPSPRWSPEPPILHAASKGPRLLPHLRSLDIIAFPPPWEKEAGLPHARPLLA